MNQNELAKLLNEVLTNDGEDVKPLDFTKPLSEQGIDSLTMTSFFFEIEDRLKKEIPDEQIDKLNSIELISNYLRMK
jgi:acyl carrier protein